MVSSPVSWLEGKNTMEVVWRLGEALGLPFAGKCPWSSEILSWCFGVIFPLGRLNFRNAFLKTSIPRGKVGNHISLNPPSLEVPWYPVTWQDTGLGDKGGRARREEGGTSVAMVSTWRTLSSLDSEDASIITMPESRKNYICHENCEKWPSEKSSELIV